MRQSRIFTSQPLKVENTLVLDGPAGHYVSRVLRLSTGDVIILFNGDGADYPAIISEVRSQHVEVRVTGSLDPATESPLRVTLVQAVCRGERMDYVLQKATELGVCRIQPLISQRVEVRLDGARQEKRMLHWQGVVTSACEQSGRAVVPEIQSPLSLPDWLSTPDFPFSLILDPMAGDRLSGVSPAEGPVAVMVGPEGGFTEDEVGSAREKGVLAVSMGPRVLRTETAGPAAIAVLQARSGDF